MSGILDEIKSRAAALCKRIVLCEGEDARVVQAAVELTRQKIARIVLLGNRAECESLVPGVDLSGIELIDPTTSEDFERYAALLHELRKDKGMTAEMSKIIAQDRTMFGALMLKSGDVDGYVSGALHSTANTLRPALQVIKTAPGTKYVSSCFIMIPPSSGNKFIKDKFIVFGDCALSIMPTADELAEIALASADTARKIGGVVPKVAMLSFSTLGSGSDMKCGNSIGKVRSALEIIKARAPELAVDGEFQFDAAIAPEVAKIKAKGSAVAGNANVFIFPDINAGNIGYKIAERLGGFTAIGPICQGFAKPLNDLSRGCCVQDIVLTVAVTALQGEG